MKCFPPASPLDGTGVALLPRVAANQAKAGVISAAKAAEAMAAGISAEADLLAARLNLELDFAELNQLLGMS